MFQLASKLAESWPPQRWQDVTVVVAVSGGADSVALLRALHSLRPTDAAGSLVVGHFNHRWRGKESDQDQQFVKDLASDLKLTCMVGTADEVASSEESARRQRHAFLTVAAHSSGARYLVTAHTADDQAETVLHRIVRGTGVAGLAGIGRLRVISEQLTLIRPLLDVRREELRRYLQSLDQPWREDPSNDDCKYTRNRIRHELIPQLETSFNPEVIDAVLRLSGLASECQAVIDPLVNELWGFVDCGESSATIDVRAAEGESSYVLRELLRRVWRRMHWKEQAMTAEHWRALSEMLSGDGNALALPGGIQAVRDQRSVRFEASG